VREDGEQKGKDQRVNYGVETRHSFGSGECSSDQLVGSAKGLFFEGFL